MSVKDLVDMLVNLSPEISRAAWDFNRLCNPGWECKVFELGSEDTENLEAKEVIHGFIDRLREEYGSFDIVLGRYFMGAFTRGAFCGEVVLDADGNAIDLVSPDPHSIRFRKKTIVGRGEVWEPGQRQGGKWKSLAIPNFRYLPVDPSPGSPYGRSLVAPSLYTSIFILGLLHDVKRVVMQQGYKRMDISVDTERAMDLFSYDAQGYATVGDYITGAIDAVKSVYRTLQPDDAFIHTDMFILNPPAGTIDSDSISAIATILDRLEKMATRALKTTGLLMESGNSPSETDSNRRWEIHAAGVKSLQHLCENMLESLFGVVLRAKGIQGRVEFRFSELRASEMLRDEQTRQLKLQNNVGEFQAGFVSQNEASNNQVGHDADSQEPRLPVEAAMQEDNNDGAEDLSKGNDDRSIFWPLGDSTRVTANGHP
jgi:hypothetical protein